jgi:hypothetical protein
MKIIDHTNSTIDTIDYIITVKRAIYLGDYVIRILFSDKTEKAIDFKHFLKRSAHPAIIKYLNEELFKGFKIIHGNLNWNDYDLIFPIDDLYNGKIK